MVNGNYVLYGDRPSSESEIVEDHVHTKTIERKSKRKINRTANELQRTLNVAQLDNETDSVKYEKKIKEPRLLRYVPTTEVKENYVTDKFETYDLKPTDELPRRYAFKKKPKNPADGSINYGYSRSSSSCSSPTGNLPTISEHCEQYGTYRIHSPSSLTVDDPVMITSYESKLDKYFSKPREVKKFAAKGSHPDSLYRVANDSGVGAGKMARTLRVLRWPIALVAVCVALAVFVYFLMPDGVEADIDTVNATYWGANVAAESHRNADKLGQKPSEDKQSGTPSTQTHTHGMKTPEIDFYEAESDKTVKITSISDAITETNTIRKLPVPPVFPTHLTPEVQYGNEKADTDKSRSPKLFEETNAVPGDSTLKPHITQKPEKPLAIYFKEGTVITTSSSTETITKAETGNDFFNYDNKRNAKKTEQIPVKPYINDGREKLTTKGIEDSPEENYFTEYEDKQITKRVEERLVSPHVLNYEEKQTTKRADEDLTPKMYFTEYEEKQIPKTANEPLIKPRRINYAEHQITKNEEASPKSYAPIYKDHFVPIYNNTHTKQKENEREPDLAPIKQEFYDRRSVKVDVNFTSGHSNLFGISIEDAEKMKSTTQSSLYNTRVSPTLPTWRDRDDTTTKKYPINVNFDVPQCRSTRLPICRGVLPYDLAGPAASIDGLDIASFLSQIEYLVATNCSDRVRHFACALLEPECSPSPYPPKLPCYNLCREIADSCDGLVPRELSSALNCNQYSNTNCVTARSPCFVRELPCGDGTCVPRDWMCDGTKDCPGGEDETVCVSCDRNEFRCPSGGCILKRWLCDGYADCPAGEDEAEDACGNLGVHDAGAGRNEPGEESAGSAPAPAVRRPNRLPNGQGRTGDYRTGESDTSKELLITSDSNNALKRNFTRRPSLSRLTPYTRPMLQDSRLTEKDKSEIKNTGRKLPSMRRFSPSNQKLGTGQKKTEKPQTIEKQESGEDVNIEDLGFFGDIDKDEKEIIKNQEEDKKATEHLEKPASGKTMVASIATKAPTRLDKSINKLERVIDGAAMMRKAIEDIAPYPESTESNKTFIERNDDFPMQSGSGLISAHASPCPSGELRCVDGRCITLAQLCDGTIDCSDHADEDNCFT